MADILGYARISTQHQDLDSQRHRLVEAGAIKIFEDVISGRIFVSVKTSASNNSYEQMLYFLF